MSASPSPRRPPAVIAGRYAIRRKLGSGSVGAVYLAYDEVERREVALKLIRTEALIERSAPRMQEEFRAIAALDHPQIARACLPPRREPSTERLRHAAGQDALVGQSAPMLDLFRGIERLAGQDLSILISGETGTGKELVARALHRRGPRRERPFRVIHCACLPPELFESELFGHVAGAFTGAERDQTGLREDAAGGTILFDDVHLLPAASQAKLVGVLESRTFRKLGGVDPISVDMRVLATTSVALRRAVGESRFLEALYYRLARVELVVPPLRERREDIPLLARHLLEQHAVRLDRPVSTLDPEAAAFLAA